MEVTSQLAFIHLNVTILYLFCDLTRNIPQEKQRLNSLLFMRRLNNVPDSELKSMPKLGKIFFL